MGWTRWGSVLHSPEQETALPLARLQGERARTASQLRMFAGVIQRGDTFAAGIDTALADRQPAAAPDLRQYQQALGPVAVLAPATFRWPFPPLAAIPPRRWRRAAGGGEGPSGHMATARRPLKRSSGRSRDAGYPAASSIPIFGTDIGAELVRHPAIQAVGFTGSLAGGKDAVSTGAAAFAAKSRCLLEMSAINPLIILPQALQTRAEALANELVASFTLGGGQFCTRPGLILALRGARLERFKSALCAAVAGSAPQVFAQCADSPALPPGRGGLAAPAYRGWQAAASPQARTGRANPAVAGSGRICWRQDALLQTKVFGPLSLLVEVDDAGSSYGGGVKALQGQLTATLRGSGRRPAGGEPATAAVRRPDGCC